MKKYYNFLLCLVPLIISPFVISCSSITNSNNNSQNPPDIIEKYGKYYIEKQSSNDERGVMKFSNSYTDYEISVDDLKKEISKKNNYEWIAEYMKSGAETYFQYTLLEYKESDKFKLFIKNYGIYKNDFSSYGDYLNFDDVNFENISNNFLISSVSIQQHSYYDNNIIVLMNFEPQSESIWENSKSDYKLTFITTFKMPQRIYY